jgi:hypothetical protein
MIPTITITLRARELAIAWLNAFLATSQSEDRPALCQTISVEVFPAGVQLICTNGHALLRTWAPNVDAINYPAPFPEPDEGPERRVVVQDASKFAKTFLQTVYSATGGDDGAFQTLILTIAPIVNEAEPPLSEELQRYGLTLAALGQELHCPLFEQEYPNWRALDFGIDKSERVDGMCLAPAMFAMVGKLRAVSRIDCAFRGEEKAIAIRATGDVEVNGLLMPMRRPEERKAPKVEVTLS